MFNAEEISNPQKVPRQENCVSQQLREPSSNKMSDPNKAESSMSFNSRADYNKETEDKNVGQLLKDIGQETKMLYMTWTSPFCESASFEEFCPNRIDKLIKEALALESKLKKQKEHLRQRLLHLSETLQMAD